MNNEFNVVLHGTLAFIEEQNFISVLIPDLGDEHIYLAGGAAEAPGPPLERGKTYVLDGVQNAKSVKGGATGDFAHLGGIVVYSCARTKDAENPLCELVLPWPNNIWSARGTLFEAGEFSGLPEGVKADQPWMFSPVSVLTYFVSPGAEPGLIGHPFRAQRDTSGAWPRMHIFAEAREPILDLADCQRHVQAEFSTVAKFFPELSNTTFSGNYFTNDTKTLGEAPASFPDAPDSKEIWSLAEHTTGNTNPCTCGCKTCCRMAPPDQPRPF